MQFSQFSRRALALVLSAGVLASAIGFGAVDHRVKKIRRASVGASLTNAGAHAVARAADTRSTLSGLAGSADAGATLNLAVSFVPRSAAPRNTIDLLARSAFGSRPPPAV